MIRDASGATTDREYDHLDVSSLAATGCRFAGSFWDHVERCQPTFPSDQVAAGQARYAGAPCPAYVEGGFLVDPALATPIEVRAFECVAAYLRNGPCMTTSQDVSAGIAELAIECEPIAR